MLGNKKLTDEQLEHIIQRIQEEHFLFKKLKFYAFLGGAFAFVVAAGLASVQGAIQAANSSGAVRATQEINKKLEEAKKLSQEITDIKKEMSNLQGQIEEFHKTLPDRESERFSKIESNFQSFDTRLSTAEARATRFSEFHLNYQKNNLFLLKPQGNDNTNHLWTEGDSIVLGGQIKLRGATGNDSFLIQHYPERGYTRLSSPTIRLETSRPGGAELVVNGNLKIENGTITVRGQEIQTK